MEKLLGIKEAASLLNVSQRWLYKAIAQRRIRFLKLNSAVRFRPSDPIAFLNACAVEPLQGACA